MKKTFFAVAILSAFSYRGMAQGKVSFDISAGISSAMVKSESDNQEDNSKSRVGLTAGVGMRIPMGTHFSFGTGLNFLQKGGKETQDQATANVILDYLELPLNLLYNTSGSSGKFFLGAGPSFAYGVSGKVKADVGGNSESAKIKFRNGDESDLKPFDMGANFITGYQFKSGIFFSANYNIGLSNIAVEDGGKWKNYYFGLKLGYAFGSGKKG